MPFHATTSHLVGGWCFKIGIPVRTTIMKPRPCLKEFKPFIPWATRTQQVWPPYKSLRLTFGFNGIRIAFALRHTSRLLFSRISLFEAEPGNYRRARRSKPFFSPPDTGMWIIPSLAIEIDPFPVLTMVTMNHGSGFH